jgi:polyisoprenoid-binding protein YceI
VKFLMVCAASLLLAPGMALATEGLWVSSAADSELGFSVWYEGEELPGRFEQFETRLELDESGEPHALTVAVEVASADMNDRQINQELGKPEWFDSAAFPRAVFSSSEIRRAGAGYLATGRLQLKGIDKALEIPLEWRRDGDSATLSGAVVLLRRDWQIGSGEWASDASLADRVELRYRVTLIRRR